MKWVRWVFICIAVLTLAGCVSVRVQHNEQEKESWKMNDAMIQMIMDASGCNERRAKAALEIFQEVRMAEPVSARSVDSNSNDIVVETMDGGKYMVSINKKYYVYSIENMATGEYVYMVVE